MMRININAFLVSILFIVICCVTLKGQQIWITPDVKVKNDFSFDILGKWPSKNTLIFRDKLFSFEIEAYNETMQFLWSKPLNLAKSKVNIIGISHVDTSFTVFFSYKRKDQTIIQAKTFNEHLKLLQTEKLFSSSNKFVNYSFRFTTSEDEKKSINILYG